MDFKKRPAYRVRDPGGILTLTCKDDLHSPYLFSPENRKTPKYLTNFRLSRVSHVYGTANMQNMHVNCKTSTQKITNNN